jgi:hypothetical protein
MVTSWVIRQYWLGCVHKRVPLPDFLGRDCGRDRQRELSSAGGEHGVFAEGVCDRAVIGSRLAR